MTFELDSHKDGGITHSFAAGERDSRLDFPSFSTIQGAPLFAVTEQPSPLDNQKSMGLDEDVDACSFKVVGYPIDANINDLHDYFLSFGELREIPKRSSTQPDTILVSFRLQKALERTFDWLQEPNAKVAGFKVKIERVAEEGTRKTREC